MGRQSARFVKIINETEEKLLINTPDVVELVKNFKKIVWLFFNL